MILSIAIIVSFFATLPAQLISTIVGDPLETWQGPATSLVLHYPGSVFVDANSNYYIATAGVAKILMVNSSSGIITTFAGTGAQGYSGDGGQAISATLFQPSGVWGDLSGNIYIADSYNNCIRKVSSSGIITTFAGTGAQGYSGDGGQATNAMLNSPSAVWGDLLGTVYIADNGNNRIRKVNSSGIISTVAGNANQNLPARAVVMTFATYVTLDSLNNNLYVADFY